MRIWIVNHYAIPPSSPGGTRHYNLALQLQKKGHEVLLIAANYNHVTHAFMSATNTGETVDTTYAVPFLWLPVPAYKGNTLARFWNMLVFMRVILKNTYLRDTEAPDIIIGSSPHLFAALGAEFLAKRLKKPFMLEIRDLWPESLVDLGRFTQKHPLIVMMKWIEGYLYKRARRVISLLPCANSYLIKRGVKPEHILWLPNFVDVDVVASVSFTKTVNEKFTIMNAGAHGVANDLDTVLAAAKILQNRGLADKIRICLVGNGPEKSRLKQLAVNEDITMVEFMDPVPKEQVYVTLNTADAYLMLLKKSPVFRWGISPNKLFDYLLMEKPIIFGVETPFNLVQEARAGLSIQSSDPEALADAIYTLSLLPKEELAAMGIRGKEYVLEHHDVKNLADKLEQLCHEVHQETLETNVKTVSDFSN